MHMENCVFCKIINKKIPSFVIDEDDDLIVFVSRENHPLIVPKKHIPNIFELDDETGSAIMKKAIKIATATKIALGSDGISVTQTNGEAAGQDVFHYHMHIYPKWNDQRTLERDDRSRQEVAEKIKEKLSLL